MCCDLMAKHREANRQANREAGIAARSVEDDAREVGELHLKAGAAKVDVATLDRKAFRLPRIESQVKQTPRSSRGMMVESEGGLG